MFKKTVNLILTIAALCCGLGGLAFIILSILGMGGSNALILGLLFVAIGFGCNFIRSRLLKNSD